MSCLPTVHPRPRGEHAKSYASRLHSTGSSPPARGTLNLPPFHTLYHRFIPARAGNTFSVTSSGLVTPVHPRPCGEHGEGNEMDNGGKGSSPPARGTPR